MQLSRYTVSSYKMCLVVEEGGRFDRKMTKKKHNKNDTKYVNSIANCCFCLQYYKNNKKNRLKSQCYATEMIPERENQIITLISVTLVFSGKKIFLKFFLRIFSLRLFRTM